MFSSSFSLWFLDSISRLSNFFISFFFVSTCLSAIFKTDYTWLSLWISPCISFTLFFCYLFLSANSLFLPANSKFYFANSLFFSASAWTVFSSALLSSTLLIKRPSRVCISFFLVETCLSAIFKTDYTWVSFWISFYMTFRLFSCCLLFSVNY